MEIIEYSDSYYDGVCDVLMDAFGYPKSGVSNSCAHEFIALDNDRVVGYFILNETIDIVKDIKIFHVDYVCVSSNCRGQGIGKKMMEYAINYAKDNGGAFMELTSGNKRVAAHKLYSSMGFEKRDSSIFRKELI